MVLPTTVLPPTVDELDIQALTNVPMPNVQPALPRVSPYSASNLPEFMQQRVEVAPGLFGPQQGLLGAAPVGAPADYGALEQQFVESFAARPEYFGRSYTPGAMMPGGLEFAPMSTDEPFDFEQGLKTAALLKAAYELKDPLKEKLFDPIIESKPVQALADVAMKPVHGLVKMVDAIIPPGTGTAIQETKDKFLNAIDERFNFGTGDTIDNLKKTFEGVSDAYGFIGDIENAVTRPGAQSMKAGIDAAESLNMLLRGQEYLPGGSIRGIEIPGVGELTDMTTEVVAGKKTGDIVSGGQVVSDEVANALILGASAYDVANFAKDPSVKDAPGAYDSASEIYKFSTGKDLPGVNTPYLQGPLAAVNVFNAAEALKGGLDTPGEVATVMSAIPSATYLGSLGASAVGATQTAASLSSLAGSLAGPLAIGATVIALPDMLEGGAAGEIPRSYRTLGFEDGNLSVLDARKIDKAQGPTETGKREFVPEQTENAMDFVNWLQNSMGYQVDQTALKKWEASDQDQIVDQYGYFEQRHKLEDPSVNAADFVTNMLRAGVLKPTAETPPINMQEALSVLNPETTYYSDLRDIQVAGNVNVPYLLSQINPYPEGFDQETGKKLTSQQIEQRQRDEKAAQAYIEREPTPPQTVGEFIGSITPQEAMALPAGFDFGQVMPNFMPDLSQLVTIPGGYNPAVRQQAYSIDKGLYDFQRLQGMLPI
ncbi:hypothetical protein N9W09_00650 [Crocinitomicaceae bacterium]|nr:hypothetical protein [Crocinitomicaceae bacterium]